MPDATTLQAISITITVVLAFAGYTITYFNNIRLENRKAQVEFSSDQLQYLYGPLYSLSHAGGEAWKSFRSRCRPGGGHFFRPNDPPTERELEEWRLWMSEVFMPMNLKMEGVIIENAHLIEEREMPKPFQDLLAHVEVYKAVVKKWERKDFSEHTAYIDFPKQLGEYVDRKYNQIKHRQITLTGRGK